MCESDCSRGRGEEHGDGGAGLRSSDSHGGYQVCCRLRHSPRQTQGRPGEGGGGRVGGRGEVIVIIADNDTKRGVDVVADETNGGGSKVSLQFYNELAAALSD